MIRALFVCAQNKLRSPTAEHVFSQYDGVECDSAGVHESAEVPIGPEQIEWADIIFVMEKAHRRKIEQKFKRHLNGKRIVVLDIPDEYEYMDDELIRVLERKVPPFLKTNSPRR